MEDPCSRGHFLSCCLFPWNCRVAGRDGRRLLSVSCFTQKMKVTDPSTKLRKGDFRSQTLSVEIGWLSPATVVNGSGSVRSVNCRSFSTGTVPGGCGTDALSLSERFALSCATCDDSQRILPQ